MSGRERSTFQERFLKLQNRRAKLRDRLQPLVTRVLREHGMFGLKLAVALQNAVAAELVPDRAARTSRDRIVAASGGRPVCWICTFPVGLDAPDDDNRALAIDRIVPRGAAGKDLGFENLRAAHRICQIARGSGIVRATLAEKCDRLMDALSAGEA